MPHKDRKNDLRYRIAQDQRRDVADRTPQMRFNRAKRNAKRRGLEFSIPFSFFQRHLQKPCFYCGELKIEQSGWMDRIDNAVGYIKKNILPACALCNYLRNDLPIDFFMNLIKRISKRT